MRVEKKQKEKEAKEKDDKENAAEFIKVDSSERSSHIDVANLVASQVKDHIGSLEDCIINSFVYQRETFVASVNFDQKISDIECRLHDALVENL